MPPHPPFHSQTKVCSGSILEQAPIMSLFQISTRYWNGQAPESLFRWRVLSRNGKRHGWEYNREADIAHPSFLLGEVWPMAGQAENDLHGQCQNIDLLLGRPVKEFGSSPYPRSKLPKSHSRARSNASNRHQTTWHTARSRWQLSSLGGTHRLGRS